MAAKARRANSPRSSWWTCWSVRLQADARVLSSSDSAVRAAHLCRIEDYARRHLGDRDLTPERTAQACGISTRYLHALYRDAGQTFVQWLHEQRLDRAEQRCAARPYPWPASRINGALPTSRISRLFKRRYGHTPGQARRRMD